MKRIKDYLRPFGLIFIYLGLQVFLQAIYMSFGIEDEEIGVYALVVIDVLTAGFVVYRLRSQLAKQCAVFKNNIKECIGILLEYWLIGLMGMMMTNAIAMSLVGGMAPNEEANRVLMNSAPYAIISVCICAPIAEELLFRLNFRNSIKSDKAFVWITALLFGAMHIIGTFEGMQDILFIVPYSILGYAFAKAYVKTGSIYSSILMHILHNSLVVLLFYAGL